MPACPFPPYTDSDSDVEATHRPLRLAPTTLLARDDTHCVDALLSYLTFHKHVATIMNVLGFETAKGRDVPRDSIVVVTQVNTLDNATLEEVLCWPPPDRRRVARALYEETKGSRAGRGGCQCRFSGVSWGDDEGRARALVLHHGDARSEIALPVPVCGEAKPVFKLPLPGSGTGLFGVQVGDAEQAPAQAGGRASAVDSSAPTLGTSARARTSTNMFIHYVRARERPSVWQRVVDALYWAYCLENRRTVG